MSPTEKTDKRQEPDVSDLKEEISAEDLAMLREKNNPNADGAYEDDESFDDEGR